MRKEKILDTNFWIYEDGRVYNGNNGFFIKADSEGKIAIGMKRVVVSELVAVAFGHEKKSEEVIEHEERIIEHETGHEDKKIEHEEKAVDKLDTNNRGVGKMNSKFTGWYLVGGVQYPSANLASRVTGNSRTTIISWCRSGKNGCKFIPV